ncbi:hypothetical protein SDJN03_10203, partial [Cucurbita argyrosperma subsp. sororia]
MPLLASASLSLLSASTFSASKYITGSILLLPLTITMLMLPPPPINSYRCFLLLNLSLEYYNTLSLLPFYVQ